MSPEDRRTSAAIESLKEQGFQIGEYAMHDGTMRVGVRSTDASALVEIGRDLWDLAAGRATLAELGARQRQQKPTPKAPGN